MDYTPVGTPIRPVPCEDGQSQGHESCGDYEYQKDLDVYWDYVEQQLRELGHSSDKLS